MVSTNFRLPAVLLIAALVAALTAGCSFFYDLDSVPIGEPDGGMQGSDAGRDMAVDMAPEPVCSPLDPESCPSGESCIYFQESGEVRCEIAEFGEGAEGDACESFADCGSELRCIAWAAPDNRGTVCSKPCSIDSGQGCGLGEFCSRTASSFPGDLGFCTRQCDVLDGFSCADGELCVPDPYYTGQGFPPFARCFENADANRGALGADCDPLRLDESGCEESLTCLTVSFEGTVGSFCLQPCISLDDCSNVINYESCESIEGATNVGYCSP